MITFEGQYLLLSLQTEKQRDKAKGMFVLFLLSLSSVFLSKRLI